MPEIRVNEKQQAQKDSLRGVAHGVKCSVGMGDFVQQDPEYLVNSGLSGPKRLVLSGG